MPIPSPEQTASWISRMTFTYMDGIIYAATKVAHLSYAQLPPLADDDSALYQSSQAFPVRIQDLLLISWLIFYLVSCTIPRWHIPTPFLRTPLPFS
jgi:hypothetical protein